MSSSSRSPRYHSRDGDTVTTTRGSREKARTNQHTTENEDRFQREHFLIPDSDQIDLNVLLDAVLDINDKLRKQEQENNDRKSDDDNSHSGSVSTSETLEKHKESRFLQEMLNPGSQIEMKGKHNFSFRNDQVFDIDRENQRLLKEITRRRPQSATTTRSRKVQSTSHKRHEPCRAKTSSEVNRIRLQKKIEQENQNLLCRIQAVKPDKSLTRENLMEGQVRIRPSSAFCSRSRPSTSKTSTCRPSSAKSSTSGGMSTRATRDYHYSTPDDNDSQSQRSFSSLQSSSRKRFPKPSWEAGW